MNDTDRRLAAFAERQHGVLTRQQARDAGLSPSAVAKRIRRGALKVCGTSTVRLPGVALDWHGQLMAGLLDLGPGALVSGCSAGRLLTLDGFDTDDLEFLVPRSLRNRTTAGVVTSTADIAPLDRVKIGAFPCTSATRTVVELLRTASIDIAGNALDSACRMRLTAVPVVRRRLAELGHDRAASRFERLIEVGTVESWLERRFVDVVQSAGLPTPELQQRHRLDGVGVVRVDFEYPLWDVVVEVGGRRGYFSRDERQRKERRRNALQLDGKTVYFFTHDDVVGHPDYVTTTLAAALGIQVT